MHDERETELVLPPGIFAFVLDKTKGNITVYSGPTKSSLSQTDQPVLYFNNTNRFEPVRTEKALQTNITAKKGQYIVLDNVADVGHPGAGKAEVLTPNMLNIGTTENIAGPANFALWPGQVANVINGHNLRSNQYVVARVYDEEAAKTNWNNAVVELKDDATEVQNAFGIDPKQLTTGRQLIIKGTEVSFYIPPTGIEVIKDENNDYIRDAVTLERLEYCILLDENGTKRYVKGPEVVFPEPTEQFVISKDKGKRKFRAYELNENSGLYIKVIADYEEGDNKYEAGDELFITGKDTAIYYPRPEHAIIRYGSQEKTYAVAIPAGEARYVLMRETGEVKLVKGPIMFMPDPRKEVMVRRILDDKTCELYYPGNDDVLDHNRRLKSSKNPDFDAFGAALAANNLDDGGGGNYTRGYTKTKHKLAAASEFGDDFKRGTTFTPPRTITLETKLDGAVTVDVWTGYAVQVVNKLGDRKVVQGPQTVVLEYDEYLESINLSRGKPKNADRTLKTVYLKTMSNDVSDRIHIVTKDLVDLVVDMKYLVRFTGDKKIWFNVDNYVQYMCDHIRSLVDNHVRQIGIQNFHTDAVEILRDIVLGPKVENNRPNRKFLENGMEIYDLEVTKIQFVDNKIEALLGRSKQEELLNTIELEKEQRNLVLITGREETKRAIERQKDLTMQESAELTLAQIKRDNELDVSRVSNQHEVQMLKEQYALEETQEYVKRKEVQLESDKKAQEQKDSVEREKLARTIEKLVAEADADKTRLNAVQPQLVAALQSMAMTGTLEQMAEHLAPLSIVRNESLSGTLHTMVKGTPLEKLLENLNGINIAA